MWWVTLSVLSMTFPVHSEHQSLRLSFGRWVASDGTNAVVPIEVTLTRSTVFSLSTGAVFSTDGVAHAYGELGYWTFISVGAGAGYGAYQSPSGRKDGATLHLFVGIPIPLTDWEAVLNEPPRFMYLLPYYRPSWGPWPGAAHEVGLMFKVNYELVRGGPWH
jgi:hypothetical protein